jgi:hypothetical protein
MTKRLNSSRTTGSLGTGIATLGLSALLGCTGEISGPPGGAGATSAGATGGASGSGARPAVGGSAGSGTGGTGTGGTGTGGTGTGGTGTGGTAGLPPLSGPCDGNPVTTQKRLVRLTDNQLVNTYAALSLDPVTMFAGEEILPATQRAFPPLATIGTKIDQTAWDLRSRAAGRVRTHVAANVGNLTQCGPTPTDSACGLNAVLAFAEKAYRRPLTAEETASYNVLWTDLTTTNGGSVAEAIEYGYSAVLQAPGFLFRTETGGDFATQGAINQHELASELSYFLTDGPPDTELLAAATANQLDPTAIRTHARRILKQQAARDNIEAAMIGYFQLTTVPSVIINADSIPGFNLTTGVKNSMYREAQEFFKNTLWQGTLGDLVTSRRTWINSQVASIYGVRVPSTDVNVFSEVMLPADRAGLLTLSPFLSAKSRPVGTSVVGRGLAINLALVCAENPLFPEGNTAVEDAIANQVSWDEKRKADFRAENPTCRGCHSQFDAMGLVLENYDSIGRFREEDPMDNPIDLAWTTSTMPESFDYDQNGDAAPDPAQVNSPVTLAQALLRDQPVWGGSNALTRCMAMNFINYALADESQGSARASNGVPPDSCAVRAVTDQFAVSPEKSFTSLLVEIAASETLRTRKPGM